MDWFLYDAGGEGGGVSVMEKLNILLLLFYRRVMSSVKFVEARECSYDALFLKRLERKEAKRKSISWGKNMD